MIISHIRRFWIWIWRDCCSKIVNYLNMYLFLLLGIIFTLLSNFHGNSALDINSHGFSYVFAYSTVFNSLSVYFFIVFGLYFYLKKNNTPVKTVIKITHISLTIISIGIDSYSGFLFYSFLGIGFPRRYYSFSTDIDIIPFVVTSLIIFIIGQVIFGFGLYKSLKNRMLSQ